MKATLRAFAVLTIVMVVFLVFASKQESLRQQRLNPPTPTLGPHQGYVRYEVHGEGHAHITITNEYGATEQYYDHLPYRREFAAPSGQVVSVAAQDGGYGEITCQIYVSGEKVRETTASGRFSTATCSGVVP